MRDQSLVGMMDGDLELVRSGTAVASPARAAFDLLIQEARSAEFKLIPRVRTAVRSVEFQYPDRRRNPFSVHARSGHLLFYLRRPILRPHPELFAAATARFGHVEPNSLGEYRARLHAPTDVADMLDFLREHRAWPMQE
jgi:hypothetical protein